MSFGYFRIFIRKDWSNFRIKSFKNLTRASYFHSNKGAVTTSALCDNEASKRVRLPFLLIKRSLHIVSSKTQGVENNDGDNFFHLLNEIEDRSNMSRKFTMNCIERMESMLDSEQLSSSQKKEIRKLKPFVKLFLKIQEKKNSIPPKDLVQILEVLDSLEMSFRSRLCIQLLSKVALQLHVLDFPDVVKFLLFIERRLPKDVASELKAHLHSKISEKINDKSYLRSSDGVVAGINLSCIQKVSNEVAENILRDVLDLKVWDNRDIYKKIFNTYLRLSPDQKNDIHEDFFKKINEEILKCNDASFVSLFLYTYGKLIQRWKLKCDSMLIDNAVNKAIELNMNGFELKKFAAAIEDMNVVHHQFLGYLVSYMKTKSDPILDDPLFFKDFVHLLANSNCDEHTVNRWRGMECVLKDSPALKIILEYYRKVPEFYTFIMLELISLGIFIDEELDHISKCFDDADFVAYPRNIWMFLVYINHAVKVLYPSYPNPLLRHNFIQIISLGLDENRPRDKDTFNQMNQILSLRSNVKNCMVKKCGTKFGTSLGAVVGVNKDGQFFDFTDHIKKIMENRNKRIYVEDINLPEGFKLITVIFLGKQDHSVNTLDVSPSRSVQFQILKRMEIPTVLIYECNWEKLHENEKGEYLHRKICDKYFAEI